MTLVVLIHRDKYTLFAMNDERVEDIVEMDGCTGLFIYMFIVIAFCPILFGYNRGHTSPLICPTQDFSVSGLLLSLGHQNNYTSNTEQAWAVTN